MVVATPSVIVAHLAPDLDCIAAIWIFKRFGGCSDVQLQFVPAGTTLNNLPVDSDPHVVHVDTGLGRFDHHQRHVRTLSAAELVRRTVAPHDPILERVVKQVTLIDNAISVDRQGCDMGRLADSFNLLYEHEPARVVELMMPNLDAWYAHELRQQQISESYVNRIEFQSPWGRGMAMQSQFGGSASLAYRAGAVVYVYREELHGWTGVAAQARSSVNLTSLYERLRSVDAHADWYLHPSKRLLLCGTAKAPVQHTSSLSLRALVDVIEGLGDVVR